MLVQLTAPANFKCKGFQQITNVTTAFALTVPTGATMALLQAEGCDYRWRDDGTDPTTSVGMVLPEHDAGTLAVAPFLYVGDLSKLKLIETTTDGVLNVSYYFQSN